MHFISVGNCFLELCRDGCSLDTSPPISTIFHDWLAFCVHDRNHKNMKT